MMSRQKKSAQNLDNQRGAALISVIMLLGLLSLLVTALSVYVSNSATSIAIARERILQNALVESALEFGMGRVLSTPPGYAVQGEDKIRLQTGRAAIKWRAESARLDLNLADAEILASLFVKSGESKDRAEELAHLIVARRSLNPAQPVPKEFKILSGRKLGPFDHPRELLDIPGFPASLFLQLEPLVTIFGATAGFDPRIADRNLLQSIPDISGPILSELSSLSGMTDEDAQKRVSDLGKLAAFIDFKRVPTVRFSIETDSGRGGTHRFEIVAIHYPDDTRPYRILSWRDVTEIGTAR